VYVQEGIYDIFLEKFQQIMREKTNMIGDPEKEGTAIGPVVDKAQFDRIMNIIDLAKSENQGILLMGGKVVGSKASTLFPYCFSATNNLRTAG
jgi:aldehyde dehydrogenase (NAD+)